MNLDLTNLTWTQFALIGLGAAVLDFAVGFLAAVVPPNYFADAPSRVPQRSEERGEPGRSSDQSQIRNPQS